VGFEPTITAFERAKTFHAIVGAATVIGDPANTVTEMLPLILVVLNTDLFVNISIPYFIIVFRHLPKQFIYQITQPWIYQSITIGIH
jgi:hypothetical protein